MKDLSSIDFKDNVRYLVRRELKALGIKVPKNKGSKIQPQESCSESVFGNSLDQVPSVNVGEEFYCSVPKFLLDATEYLENHLGTEGLFRKSGSIQRQKNLKQKIENGESISDVQAHDVASLLKQFFRQLPEPLLTNQLNECFAKCQRLDCENSCAQAILYLCLLLPLPHLHTLQYFMRFAAKVASHAKESKMGTSNLAIVLTPNLINNPKKENSSSSEKILKDQTSVIDTLLKNSTQIGLVPDDVFERAKMIGGDDIDGLTSSGDELEDNQLRRGNSRMSRPRARTKSITGFVSGLGQRWKNSSAKTPGVARSSHRRSRSVKAEIMSNKDRSHPEYEYVTQKTTPKAVSVLDMAHQAVGTALPAVIIVFVSSTTEFWQALLCLTLCLSLNGMTTSGSLVNPQDLAPKFAGSVSGLQLATGAIPGILGVYVTGYILHVTGSWSAVFQLIAGTCIFGTVVFIIFGKGKKIV